MVLMLDYKKNSNSKNKRLLKQNVKVEIKSVEKMYKGNINNNNKKS